MGVGLSLSIMMEVPEEKVINTPTYLLCYTYEIRAPGTHILLLPAKVSVLYQMYHVDSYLQSWC